MSKLAYKTFQVIGDGGSTDNCRKLAFMYAIHLIRELIRTPWSVRTVALRDEAVWFAQNNCRRRLALSKLERDLLFAGEHPLRLAFSLLGLQVALLALASVLPQGWFTPAWLKCVDSRPHFTHSFHAVLTHMLEL